MANAAGPVMNMYLLTQNLAKEQFVSRQSLIFDLMMVPAAVGGAYAGLWFMRRIPQGVFDTLIVVMTAAASSVFLFR